MDTDGANTRLIANTEGAGPRRAGRRMGKSSISRIAWKKITKPTARF